MTSEEQGHLKIAKGHWTPPYRIDLHTHGLHHAHPPPQVQGLGPGKRVQVKGNTSQNVSI